METDAIVNAIFLSKFSERPSICFLKYGSIADIKVSTAWVCVSSESAYRNIPKFSDRQVWANSADPDQTAPRGAV